MDIIIESLHPTPKAWLLKSALVPHLESYCAHFRLGRYAATYSVACVAGLAHFARWMAQCGLAVEQLDAHKVEQFLDEHLPCCDCPKPVKRDHHSKQKAFFAWASKAQALGYLRIESPAADAVAPLWNLMDKYDDLPMDFCDASLVYLATSLKIHRIATVDRRDFSVYRLPGNKRFVHVLDEDA